MKINELKNLISDMNDYRSYSATESVKARGASYTNGPQSQSASQKAAYYQQYADSLLEQIVAAAGSEYHAVAAFASDDNECVADVISRRNADTAAWLAENYK